MDFFIKQMGKQRGFLLALLFIGAANHVPASASELPKISMDELFSFPLVLQDEIGQFAYGTNPLNIMPDNYLGYTVKFPEANDNSAYLIDNHDYIMAASGPIKGKNYLYYCKLYETISPLPLKKITKMKDCKFPNCSRSRLPLITIQNTMHAFVLKQTNQIANVFYVFLPTSDGPKFKYYLKFPSSLNVDHVMTGDANSNIYFIISGKSIEAWERAQKTEESLCKWKLKFSDFDDQKRKLLSLKFISCNRDMSRVIVRTDYGYIDKEGLPVTENEVFAVLDGLTGDTLKVHSGVTEDERPICCAMEEEGRGYNIVYTSGKIEKYNQFHSLRKTLHTKVFEGSGAEQACLSSDLNRIMWGKEIEGTYNVVLTDKEPKRKFELIIPSDFDIGPEDVPAKYNSTLTSAMFPWSEQINKPGRQFAIYAFGKEKLKINGLLAQFLMELDTAFCIVKEDQSKQNKSGKEIFSKVRAVIIEGSPEYEKFIKLPAWLQSVLCRNFRHLFRIYGVNHPRHYLPEMYDSLSKKVAIKRKELS